MVFLLRLGSDPSTELNRKHGSTGQRSAHTRLWPARPSVKTYPVAEVRAGRENCQHAHIDQEGLPVCQRVVLVLLGRQGLSFARDGGGGTALTLPHDPPSDFNVWTRAEGSQGQRSVSQVGERE